MAEVGSEALDPGRPVGHAATPLGPRPGTSLIVAGAALWLVHSVLMLVGLAVVFGYSLVNLSQGLGIPVASVFAYVGATVAALLASFLMGSGLLLYQGGGNDLTGSEGAPRRVALAPDTRKRAKAACAAFLASGVLGVVAVSLLFVLMGGGGPITLAGAVGVIQALLATWIVATIVLAAAGSLTASFLKGLGRERVLPGPVRGAGLRIHAILNVVGVVLFSVPLLFLMSPDFANSIDVAIFVIVGASLELLLAPIAGIAVFYQLVRTAQRLRGLGPDPVANLTAGTALGPPDGPAGGVGSPPNEDDGEAAGKSRGAEARE